MVTFSEGSATLNGKNYLSKSVINQIGNYYLLLTDLNGNKKSISFVVIDSSYPIVTGISDGGVYTSKFGDLTINFNKGMALLNGSPFTSGAKINATGVYNLIVSSNNTTIVNFTYIRYGDANGDGNVNVSDLALIKKHLLKQNILLEINKDAADFNENGNITISDLITLKKIVLGIEE